MGNVTRLFSEREAVAVATDHLGPARVIAVKTGAVLVELEDGAEVSAVLALAFPCAPAPGDVVLAIGRADRHYVIGVIHGTGRQKASL